MYCTVQYSTSWLNNFLSSSSFPTTRSVTFTMHEGRLTVREEWDFTVPVQEYLISSAPCVSLSHWLVFTQFTKYTVVIHLQVVSSISRTKSSLRFMWGLKKNREKERKYMGSNKYSYSLLRFYLVTNDNMVFRFVPFSLPLIRLMISLRSGR